MRGESQRQGRELLTRLAGVSPNVVLAPLTTFKVGGPCDWFFDAQSSLDVAEALATASRLGIRVTVLGRGSNVLIGDVGIRGLVLRLRQKAISVVRPGVVRASAGVTLNELVRWTIRNGLAGLEIWAGTPGTVGGAVHGNAHFQGRLLGTLVRRVGLCGLDGRHYWVDRREMQFRYDSSRVQSSDEVVTWVEFEVNLENPDLLRKRARKSIYYRKETQPLKFQSAGCIFRNPNPRVEAVPDGVAPSAGALIDLAGLKGSKVGTARVSEQHGNFIVSDGRSSANEIRALIERCQMRIRSEFGISLKREVVYLGEFS